MGPSEIALFSIGQLSEITGEKGVEIDDLANALDLSRSRVLHLVGDLKKEGYLRREGRAKVAVVSLTPEGSKRYMAILEELKGMDLVPERFGIARHARASLLFDMVNDPTGRVRLISAIMRKGKVDLLFELHRIQALEPGSRERMLIEEIAKGASSDKEDLEEAIAAFMMDALEDHEGLSRDVFDPDRILLEAESLKREGRMREARSIYNHLLFREEGLDPGRWMICIIGTIQTTRALETVERTLHLIEGLLDRVHDPIHRALIDKFKADALSEMRQYDRATRTYQGCMSTFRSAKMPMMEISILVNMGVMYFRQGKIDLAERYWSRARNNARVNGLDFLKTLAEINLADCYAQKGRIKRAKEMLRKARAHMLEIVDLDRVSGVDFNRALVCVAEGRKDLALRYFSMSEEYPMIDPERSAERRQVLNERFIQKGWPVPFSI